MQFKTGKKTEGGYLAVPEKGSGPGVLVLHAWWGLNDFFVGLCDRLAREGFVALAPDLYGGVIASTIDEAKEVQKRAEGDPDAEAATQEKVLLALDALRNHASVSGPKVGVLGFSMGVWWALQASALRPESVAAATLFYGAGEADFAVARCAYQIHFAENDTWEDIDYARQVEAAMHAAGREATLYVYPNVGHWFFETDRPDAYDADAAQQAWNRTVSFLHDSLADAG